MDWFLYDTDSVMKEFKKSDHESKPLKLLKPAFLFKSFMTEVPII